MGRLNLVENGSSHALQGDGVRSNAKLAKGAGFFVNSIQYIKDNGRVIIFKKGLLDAG